MASKVNQFLNESGGNNFTETAPRPPVPGEENELQSNGGMSSRSSGSHKSQVSHSSCRSIGSNKGDATNPATPRKSNLDKTGASLCSLTGIEGDPDAEAPLGFEPEGSAANSPPFTENSTPPYLKWAESLKYLLSDRDGVQLFANFLRQEGFGSSMIDFWFACEGLKKKEKSDTTSIQNVIRVIHKRYIKSDKLPCISSATKQRIAERIQPLLPDQDIFDSAQQEVEADMRSNSYPLFIKSDLYVHYVSKGGESPKSSNSSSGSNSARPTSGLLPTLQEDEELQTSDLSSSFYMEPFQGPPTAKLPKAHFDPKKPEVYSNTYSSTLRPHPYHSSYAPVSAQDSEIQSLSSQDAMTDDTRSLTDSSLDGFSHGGHSRKRSKQHKVKQRLAAHNREESLFIPRTAGRAPKDRNIAETNCALFAEQLSEKLRKVLAEREKNERLQISLNQVMNAPDPVEPSETSFLSTSAATSLSHGNNTTTLAPLLTSSMIDEENADSILEEHCSRIWESSNQQTPNRSPGRHSPKQKSPERSRKAHSQMQAHTGPSSMPGTLHSKSLHRKRPDYVSQLSFDSGVCDEKPLETHKHIHHHYHHVTRERRFKHKLELEAQHHTMVCWGESTPRPHGGGAGVRKAGIRNHSSDVSSNIDSGISLIDSIPPQVVPNVTDPSRTKVLQWMMDNENVNCGGSAYPDSDKSSSHKRSHRSSGVLAPGQPPQYKQSSVSKKSNRSTSADSGRRLPWPQSQGVMPSQPFVQDPQMPLMPAPNTTAQLEEVNRRLEADNSKMAPVKSKSFAGVPSKDKRFGVQVSQTMQGRSGMSATRTVPADLDLSAESNTSHTMEKKKRSSGSGNTSTSSKAEETVIGYYLCGEPIPYRTTIPQANVTLGQLKHHISKRGNYRYFFKTVNKDFDSDVVYEEIKDDHTIIPVYEGKVVCKVEKIE